MHNKKKKIWIFFGCIQTMINILIIFFTQYFQEKISDPMIRISPFQPKGSRFNHFLKFYFLT
jgi:hypothetical protein